MTILYGTVLAMRWKKVLDKWRGDESSRKLMSPFSWSCILLGQLLTRICALGGTVLVEFTVGVSRENPCRRGQAFFCRFIFHMSIAWHGTSQRAEPLWPPFLPNASSAPHLHLPTHRMCQPVPPPAYPQSLSASPSRNFAIYAPEEKVHPSITTLLRVLSALLLFSIFTRGVDEPCNYWNCK